MSKFYEKVFFICLKNKNKSVDELTDLVANEIIKFQQQPNIEMWVFQKNIARATKELYRRGGPNGPEVCKKLLEKEEIINIAKTYILINSNSDPVPIFGVE